MCRCGYRALELSCAPTPCKNKNPREPLSLENSIARGFGCLTANIMWLPEFSDAAMVRCYMGDVKGVLSGLLLPPP